MLLWPSGDGDGLMIQVPRIKDSNPIAAQLPIQTYMPPGGQSCHCAIRGTMHMHSPQGDEIAIGMFPQKSG